MLISDCLKQLEVKLNNNQIEEPRLEAELLIRGSLNITKAELLLKLNENLTNTQLDDIKKRLIMRLKGIPSAYILGHKEFFNNSFKVNENVLIPRPETEIMVEDAIREFKNKKVAILDMCTGSGCIAITLSLELPSAAIYASDISDEALNIAEENASILKTPIKFIKSNLFEKIKGSFDAILTNPPYVPTLDMPDSHEPELALNGGNDGLDIIRRILKDVHNHLNDNGICWIEMAINQYPIVERIALENFNWKKAEAIRDLAGINRFIKLQK